MRSAFAFFTAGLAALASAYTTPTTGPAGNPIAKPGLNEAVPAGQAYTITWTPTTQGTVTLVLLRGPSENILPLYPIVEKVPNTGSYIWTPATNLVPDVTHYGLQIIDDATGQYQWSTQFGISNPSFSSSASSSVVASSTPAPASSSAVKVASSSAMTSMMSSMAMSSSVVTSSIKTVVPIPISSGAVLPSGSPVAVKNATTIVTPTLSTLSTASKTPSSASTPAVQTVNAAAGLQVGGFLGAVAAFAVFVL